MKKNMIIAIDGHSSCGKSTYAKKIAHKYIFHYVDSGAMYRATTLFAIRNNLLQDGQLSETGIDKILHGVTIDFRKNPDTGNDDTFLNDECVETKIRGLEVSNLVSEVSKVNFIRKKMVALQRKLAEKKSIVMDGRDIGTVVFPDADIKLFLTARPTVRAQRRFDELKAKGIPANYEEVLENIKKRDFIDENRDIAPLKKARDAITLDNSNMTVNDQMKWFAENFEKTLT